MSGFISALNRQRKEAKGADPDTHGRFKEIVAIIKKYNYDDGITPEITVNLLTDLGPTFVKIGQIASQQSEYLPPEDSAKILNDLWQDTKNSKLQDAMRPLAEKLDADIVVCPILKQYSQIVVPSSWNETIMRSYVRVELIVYDRRTDNLTDKKAAQMYNDSYHPHGTAAQLSKLCFDRVIDATNLRRLIRDIRN